MEAEPDVVGAAEPVYAGEEPADLRGVGQVVERVAYVGVRAPRPELRDDSERADAEPVDGLQRVQ